MMFVLGSYMLYLIDNIWINVVKHVCYHMSIIGMWFYAKGIDHYG